MGEGERIVPRVNLQLFKQCDMRTATERMIDKSKRHKKKHTKKARVF